MDPESTRRDFLRAGTATTAGLVAAGAGALAAEQPQKPKDEPAKPAHDHDHHTLRSGF